MAGHATLASVWLMLLEYGLPKKTNGEKKKDSKVPSPVGQVWASHGACSQGLSRVPEGRAPGPQLPYLPVSKVSLMTPSLCPTH